MKSTAGCRRRTLCRSDTLMEDMFRSYWWLLFPIGAFVFGAWDRWLAYKRSRDHLELLKHYAAQGKEPPPGIVQGARNGDPAAPPGADPGYGGYWGYPYGRRAWRRYYRWGPYWQWRSVISTGAIAAGFWWASEYADWPGVEGPFRILAIILTVIAAGNLLMAILFSTTHRDR
jgi:hypothetical protein